MGYFVDGISGWVPRCSGGMFPTVVRNCALDLRWGVAGGMPQTGGNVPPTVPPGASGRSRRVSIDGRGCLGEMGRVARFSSSTAVHG